MRPSFARLAGLWLCLGAGLAACDSASEPRLQPTDVTGLIVDSMRVTIYDLSKAYGYRPDLRVRFDMPPGALDDPRLPGGWTSPTIPYRGSGTRAWFVLRPAREIRDLDASVWFQLNTRITSPVVAWLPGPEASFRPRSHIPREGSFGEAVEIDVDRSVTRYRLWGRWTSGP